MKKLLFTAAVAAAIVSLSFTYLKEAPHGDIGTTTLRPDVTSFDAIEIEYPLRAIVSLQDGATPGVELDGDEEALDNIKIKVRNNTLVITSKHNYNVWHSDGGVTAQITLPTMTGLSITGSARAETIGNVKGNKLKVSISGSGSATIANLNVNSLTTEISGSGKIVVNDGAVAYSNHEISGSGKISAFSLKSKTAEVSIAGSGKSEITASDKLSVSVYGSGLVYYKGHPAAIEKDIAGSGGMRIAD